jgi:hypothetical protein
MAKCYIIACVVCGKLFDATGRNAITCSRTCRVWLKRHPEYSQFLREICRKLEITPFDMLRAEAARFLRPYFDSRIASGEFTWKDFQTEMAGVLEEFAIKEAGGSLS